MSEVNNQKMFRICMYKYQILKTLDSAVSDDKYSCKNA